MSARMTLRSCVVGAVVLASGTVLAEPVSYLDAQHLVASYGNNVYRYVTSPLNWNAALAASATYSWNGRTGHLATVTSLAENDFIYSAFVGPRIAAPGADVEQATPWIALSDAAAEGNWVWAAGPEFGQVATFTNWNVGEPNNLGDEDYSVLHWQDRGLGTGKWYDYSLFGGSGGGQAFVVEFENAIAPVTVTLGDAFTYNHCAQNASGVIRLTNPGGTVPASCTPFNDGNLQGTAFASSPLALTANTSFSASFAYRIWGGQGANGADGLAFILQNDSRGASALGGGGGGQGWAKAYPVEMGIPQINPSWIVTVDTYNYGNFEPSGNYIGFRKLSTPTEDSPFYAYNPPSYDLNDGTTQFIWIDYSATTHILTVYASATNTKPLSELFSVGGQHLAELGDRFYVGFSAGTGGLQNVHDIEQFSFTTMDVSTLPAAVNDGPIAVIEGVAQVLPVGANDSGFTNPVTVTVTTPPTKGTITAITPPGPAAGMTVTYTANVGAVGDDSFVYAMTDSSPATESATVTLRISQDTDGDGVVNETDNCTLTANADQRDTNGDGYGNICDPDFNNNGIVDSQDGAILKATFGGAYRDFDLNGNGIVDSNDGARLKAKFGKAPGPSGLRP